ncbi:AMP-binding protein [Corynebacterium sp. P5848]|nr:AMP-binding protein [Corynebacterium marambiense]
MTWQTDTFGIGPGDRCACLTPPTFDVFLRDELTPLSSGATLVLPGDDDVRDPAAFLAAASITVCHVVPSLAARWLRRAQGTCESLRLAFFTGEALYARHVVALRQFAPNTRVINLYGPSETTLAKFFSDATEWCDDGVCPVGVPLPGTRYRLQAGEVHIGPPLALSGYVHREDPHFYRDDDRWLFATGDLGYDSGAGLVIEGRTDQQVKIAGVRVNTTDVAAVIAACSGVENAAVLPVADELGTHLAGFAQARMRTAEQIREQLVDRLPATHLPARPIVCGDLPLTVRGKTRSGSPPGSPHARHPRARRRR